MKHVAVPSAYTLGTYRTVSPEETLKKITPLLSEFGITRCAEITRLDYNLGVPTFSAIRPKGRVLQVSNGKGVSKSSAKVSALMEAVELHHAENEEPGRWVTTSEFDLNKKGKRTISPKQLGMDHTRFYSSNYRIPWVEAELLPSSEKVWVPACAAWFTEPSPCKTTTNGLASGNHIQEASLHALYEMIERDAISGVDEQGVLKIQERCEIIDPMSVTDPLLQEVIQTFPESDSELVLLSIKSELPVYTFWAVLLNKQATSSHTTLNAGFGTHSDPIVAAYRAVTEAVQSRLALIHGAREDIVDQPAYSAHSAQQSPAYQYFEQLRPNRAWSQLIPDNPEIESDIDLLFSGLIEALKKSGHEIIIRVNLTHSQYQIPVVKLLIPSFRFLRHLF